MKEQASLGPTLSDPTPTVPTMTSEGVGDGVHSEQADGAIPSQTAATVAATAIAAAPIKVRRTRQRRKRSIPGERRGISERM